MGQSNKQIVLCAHCHEMLWMITAHTPNTPATRAAKKVKQEWSSMQPGAFKNPPKDWDCPLCGEKFVEIKGPKVYLKTRAASTGQVATTLLEKYSR